MRAGLPCAVLVLVATTTFGQVPAGPEFHISTTGYSPTRIRSDVTSDGNGNFVVTWQDYLVFNNARIMARRYSAGGAALGPAFTVSSATIDNRFPGIASDRLGSFSVVWEAPDGDQRGIRGRQYDPAGSPRGPDFPINAITAGIQFLPAAGSDSARNLFVVWSDNSFDGSSWGIAGQRISSLGIPVGPEFQVNTYTLADQINGRVASNAAGRVVVVWTSEAQDGSGFGIFGQRYDAAGPVGAEFRVNASTAYDQLTPAVDIDASGNFIVVWESDHVPGFDSDIYGQRFAWTGTTIGPEFLVNSARNGRELDPRVSATPNGDFVVVWSSDDSGTGLPVGIAGQRYDSAGARRGGEFRVNTWTTDIQGFPAAASDDAGNFVVTWDSYNQVNAVDVFGQRFAAFTPPPPSVDPGGNGVFEPGEGVGIATSWHNASGAPQTVTGSASLFTGPGAPNNPTYTIVDAVADYGTVPNGATISCTATGNCFAFSIGPVSLTPAARPVLHWDATFREDILPAPQGPPVTHVLHIGDSFADVLRASPYYRFVETILHHDLTGGCGGGNFCPVASTPREQMAVFVLVAKEGASYQPPACVPGLEMFADVAASSPFCRWIEELAHRNIAGGCGGGNFCPLGLVSREQMSVFALATKEAAGYSPPACVAGSERFADVPASSPFCKWVEELARRGITGGCGGGNFCPILQVSREQNAVFVTGTFGLELY